MSNRYVWNRYEITESEVAEKVTQGYLSNYPDDKNIVRMGRHVRVSSYPIGGTDGQYAISSPYEEQELSYGVNVEVPANRYFAFYDPDRLGSRPETYLALRGGCIVEVQEDYRRANLSNANKVHPRRSKGTANGTVSNSASSTYPPNDTQPRIASICVIPAILRRCKYVE